MKWEFDNQGESGEMDGILSALSSIYSGIFLINLKDDSYIQIKAIKPLVSMFEGITSARQAIDTAMHKTVFPDEIKEPANKKSRLNLKNFKFYIV